MQYVPGGVERLETKNKKRDWTSSDKHPDDAAQVCFK